MRTWLLTKWRRIPAPLRGAVSGAACAMVGMAISDDLLHIGEFVGAGVGALAYITVLVLRDFHVP